MLLLDQFIEKVYLQRFQAMNNFLLIKDLSPYIIDKLCHQWNTVDLFRNQDIYEENDPVDNVYLVLQGEVEVIIY